MFEQELTDCELLVMKVIWATEEAMSIQEIATKVNHVYNKNWEKQTVSVFLGRIVRRGFLRSERKGRHFFYYPTVSEEDYAKMEVSKCADLWGGGRADQLIAILAKARNLSDVEKNGILSLVSGIE